MNLAEIQAIVWPEPASVPIRYVGQGRDRPRVYTTPDGEFVGVTSALKSYGGGQEALMKWAADLEHRAALEAAASVWQRWKGTANEDLTEPAFVEAVEKALGPAKQHQLKKDAAANAGKLAHSRVQWELARMLGQPVGPEPTLPDESLWAFMAWEDWWKQAGLTPLRVEQPVWHPQHGYAGTVDLIAVDSQGLVGVLDLKTSRYIYDSHHLQVSAYVYAVNRWMPVDWAKLVRLPKSTDDPAFEVVPLGKMYDRTLSAKELFETFLCVLETWKMLMSPKGGKS